MENGIEIKTLKNAEILLRTAMIITTLVAGISKLCSNGSFHKYYLKLFTNPGLRINLPALIFDIYLSMIPFIELGIAIALITGLKRRLFIVVFVLYFISLEIGHYILEEFTSVDLITLFVFLGVSAYILPAHQNFWQKSKSHPINYSEQK